MSENQTRTPPQRSAEFISLLDRYMWWDASIIDGIGDAGTVAIRGMAKPTDENGEQRYQDTMTGVIDDLWRSFRALLSIAEQRSWRFGAHPEFDLAGDIVHGLGGPPDRCSARAVVRLDVRGDSMTESDRHGVLGFDL